MAKQQRKHPSPTTIIAGLGKDYRPLAKAAVDAGWTLTQSGGGHAKLTMPDGRVIPLPGTSKGRGLYRSIVSQLRRAGLDLGPR